MRLLLRALIVAASMLGCATSDMQQSGETDEPVDIQKTAECSNPESPSGYPVLTCTERALFSMIKTGMRIV
jgi:hypothetical protein